MLTRNMSMANANLVLGWLSEQHMQSTAQQRSCGDSAPTQRSLTAIRLKANTSKAYHGQAGRSRRKGESIF